MLPNVYVINTYCLYDYIINLCNLHIINPKDQLVYPKISLFFATLWVP